MTSPNETAVNGFAFLERNARKDTAPARSDEAISNRAQPSANVELVGKRAPRRLAGRARTTEIDESSAETQRTGKHRASRKGVDVELKRVGALVSAPRALVVHDVDGTVRPDDHEVHAPAQDDRPTLRILDGEDEVDLATELGTTLGDQLRVGSTEETRNTSDDCGVLRVLGRNALCDERTARSRIGVGASEGRCGYPLQYCMSQSALQPCIETCRAGTRGIRGSRTAYVLRQPEERTSSKRREQ